VTNLPVPNPRTFVAGEFEDAAYFNAFRDAINFLANKPLAVLYQAVAQSIPTGTPTPLTLDSTTVDTYGGHSNTTNNTRYAGQVAGWYRIIGTASFNNTTGGNRGLNFHVNGVNVPQFGTSLPVASAAVFPQVTATAVVFLNVGDYVEICGYQDNGSAVATHANGSSMAVFWDHA
jgi:hypothetical protein